MLRGLLRDSEAAKALFEKAGLFKSPEMLEKYVIASEVTVEVLDLFLSRVFGTERASICNSSDDLKALWENLGCVCLSGGQGAAGEDSPSRDDECDKVAGLCVKVQDLERQLCAVQRQLQMQGEVSQLAASLDGRLDEIARECGRQAADVNSRVSAVSQDVANLKKEVGSRASAGDVERLSKDVLRLKEGERSLGDRISSVDRTAAEARRVLKNEIQGEIKKLGAVTKIRQIDPLTNGIIAHLTRVCGGNVHERGAVEVTASSTIDSSLVAKNAVELGTDSRFSSNDNVNSWIRYHFKGRRVSPVSYSIRSGSTDFPRSWVFEVSKHGRDESWVVVDRRENNNDLNGKFVTRNFAVGDPPRGSYRFIRLRQTGTNHSGRNFLEISSLEVFGTLSPQ